MTTKRNTAGPASSRADHLTPSRGRRIAIPKDGFVLVVGTQRLPREGLGDALRHWGFASAFAATCDEALRKVYELAPRAVLVELDIPDGRAVELVQTLRASDASTAIAALLPEDGVEALQQVRDAGLTLTDHFAEPIQLSALRGWLEEAFDRSDDE